MSDLREKLLKAGLVTEEQAKKSEQRTPPPRPPRPGGPPQDRGSQAQPPQRPAAPPLDDEAKNRLKQLAQAGKLDGKTRGHRRWYYTSRRGVVPYLEVSDEVVAMLEQGGAAVAEAPSGEAWLVTGDCARKLRDVHADGAREWLRVFNAR